MPTIIKRSYQYFYIASIIFITGLFAYFPDYIINGEDKIFNFIVNYLIINALTIGLLILEFKMQVFKIIPSILKIIITLIFPILFIVIKFEYLNIILIAVSTIILIIDLYTKRKKDYSFDVKDFKLINVIYIFSLIIPIILLLTKQKFWYLGLVYILISFLIETMMYVGLKNVFNENEAYFYLSIVGILLVPIIGFYGNLTFSSTFNILENILFPLITVILTIILIYIFNKKVNLLIKDGSIE